MAAYPIRWRRALLAAIIIALCTELNFALGQTSPNQEGARGTIVTPPSASGVVTPPSASGVVNLPGDRGSFIDPPPQSTATSPAAGATGTGERVTGGYGSGPTGGYGPKLAGTDTGSPSPTSSGGNSFSGNVEALSGDLPIAFVLALTLFVFANALFERSGRLLRAIVIIRSDLFSPEAKHIENIKGWGLAAIVAFYVITFIVLLANRFFRASPYVYKDDIFPSIGLYILYNPDVIAPLLFVLAIAPAAVAMLNFTLFSALSSRLAGIPETPGPSIGVIGALMSLISVLGSLAGIGRLFIHAWGK